MSQYIIGWDFGSSNSCISYYDTVSQKVIIIPNEQGNLTTPSLIFLNSDSSEMLFGETASQLENNLGNLKRLIGKKCIDDNNNISNLICEDDNLFFNIKFNNVYKNFSVETLISFYLNYLKNIILQFFCLKECTFDIVITVPAYFNDNQRSIIKSCCQVINLNVIRIINEPTAASLAYAMDSKQKVEEEYVLTFDIGGGTTDISLLHLDYLNEIYVVKNTIGDNFLGGEDITLLLNNYIIEKLKLKDISIKQSKQIYKQAEKCKKVLSSSNLFQIVLEFGEINHTLSITKSIFNELSKNIFRKIENLIYYLLDDYMKITKDFQYNNIDSIIFVGGTSRIPYFIELFTKILPNAKINNTIDPDTTISIGASIQGALLKNLINTENGGDTLLMDILPLSIGIETLGGIMSPVISRNSLLPISRTMQFTNSTAFDDIIIIDIYQGERRFVIDNNHIGTFSLISPLFKEYDKGKIIIDITFTIDSNSIITAKANATINNQIVISEVIVTKNNGKISTINIEDMIYYSESNKLIDLELSNKILAKIKLYDSFKYLLSVFHQNRNQHFIDEFTTNQLNILFNKTFNYIEDFINYTSCTLKIIQTSFENEWHTLLFTQNIIFKDTDGMIIEYGGIDIKSITNDI